MEIFFVGLGMFGVGLNAGAFASFWMTEKLGRG